MNIKFLIALLASLLTFLSTSDAAKIDVYRDAMSNKSFTLKYELTRPPVRDSSRDAKFTAKGLIDNAESNFFDLPHSGLIVVDGDNKYIEIAHSGYFRKIGNTDKKIREGGICRLIKDNETFNFFWEIENDQKHYFARKWGGFGSKTSKITADDVQFKTPHQLFFEEYTFGTPLLTHALTAILPPDKIIAFPITPEYKFMGSSNLADGLTCEDFASDKANRFNAVRYYFNGDQLVKIAFASYIKNASGIQSYEKAVIDITEFSTTPDQNYLQLPAELKDATKRDDKEAAK